MRSMFEVHDTLDGGTRGFGLAFLLCYCQSIERCIQLHCIYSEISSLLYASTEHYWVKLVGYCVCHHGRYSTERWSCMKVFFQRRLFGLLYDSN